MLKITLVSVAPPQTPLGELTTLPQNPYSRKRLLAFHKFSKVCLLLKLSLATPLVSTPNTIHHNRLTVCLPDSLDLDPLPIDFVLVKRL